MLQQVTEPLLVTSRVAASMLSISERSLWSLSKTGQIPRIKLGGKQSGVRYAVEDLRKWVSSQKQDLTQTRDSGGDGSPPG